MTSVAMVRLLEELSLNAWPALQTTHDDGWVLRMADGHTRRANSVQLLYAATSDDPAAKIARCEALYHAHGLPSAFKLTSLALTDPTHTQIEELLASYGYERNGETSIQTLDLANYPSSMPQGGPSTSAIMNIDMGAMPSSWLDAVVEFGLLAPMRQTTLKQMLANLVPRHGFAMLTVAGKPVAVGLGVVERGYLGLFDIGVHPQQRRQGFGRVLINEMLAWGQAQGAHTAYLQVMEGNAPALALYAQLGFREQYRYWYRVKPPN